MKLGRKKYLYVGSILMVLTISMILISMAFKSQLALNLLLVETMIIIICNIIINRKNNITFIFNIFVLMYYIPLIKKIFLSYTIVPYDYTLVGDKFIATTISYVLFGIVFSIGVMIFNNHSLNSSGVKNLKIYDNNLIYIVIIILMIVTIYLGHKGSISILVGGYGSTGGRSTVFNEYSIILFLYAFIFSGKSKFKIKMNYFFSMLYCIINFLYGDRIGVLMLGILIFVLYINNKINYKKVVIIGLLILVVFNMVGDLRVGQEIKILNANKVIDSNEGNVLVASNQIVKLREEKYLTKQEIKKSFGEYILRILINKNNLSDLADVLKYAYNSSGESLGGGFIAVYFYFWFGPLGVIAIGIIVAYIVCKLTVYRSSYKGVFLIMITVFFPRWLVYEPLQMIKIPIIAVLGYGVLRYINNLMGIPNVEVKIHEGSEFCCDGE